MSKYYGPYFSLLQNVSNKCQTSKWNEVESIKFLVRCSLSTLSVGFRGQYTNVKFCSVDLPLSIKAFSTFFAVEYNNEDSFKKTVSVDDLNGVLGSNWHSYQFEKSSTRRRVIGHVQLHYRIKKNSHLKKENVSR